jgi:tetratricopeptide (TPR) repeat protein
MPFLEESIARPGVIMDFGNFNAAADWQTNELERHEEAIAAERRAQELDPLSLIINKNVGTILYYAGRHDESIAQYKKTLELDKDFVRTHFYLGMTYLQKAMYKEAIDEYRRQ